MIAKYYFVVPNKNVQHLIFYSLMLGSEENSLSKLSVEFYSIVTRYNTIGIK